jgi:hypothetical protein
MCRGISIFQYPVWFLCTGRLSTALHLGEGLALALRMWVVTWYLYYVCGSCVLVYRCLHCLVVLGC